MTTPSKIVGFEHPSYYTDTLATWERYLSDLKNTADADWEDPALKREQIAHAESVIASIKKRPFLGQPVLAKAAAK